MNEFYEEDESFYNDINFGSFKFDSKLYNTNNNRDDSLNKNLPLNYTTSNNSKPFEFSNLSKFNLDKGHYQQQQAQNPYHFQQSSHQEPIRQPNNYKSQIQNHSIQVNRNIPITDAQKRLQHLN